MADSNTRMWLEKLPGSRRKRFRVYSHGAAGSVGMLDGWYRITDELHDNRDWGLWAEMQFPTRKAAEDWLHNTDVEECEKMRKIALVERKLDNR